jgi:hypothetical protein
MHFGGIGVGMDFKMVLERGSWRCGECGEKGRGGEGGLYTPLSGKLSLRIIQCFSI